MKIPRTTAGEGKGPTVGLLSRGMNRLSEAPVPFRADHPFLLQNSR